MTHSYWEQTRALVIPGLLIGVLTVMGWMANRVVVQFDQAEASRVRLYEELSQLKFANQNLTKTFDERIEAHRTLHGTIDRELADHETRIRGLEDTARRFLIPAEPRRGPQ